MKKVKGDSIKIQVAIWEGGGKPVLCVHGLTANCRCWDTIASALAPGHKVIAMDLRGRGFSDAPPSGYSVEHHCWDILSLIDGLNLKKVVLMGHSLGAFISLAFAARYPERVAKVILVDGGGRLSEAQMTKVLAGIKPSVERLGQVFPTFEAYTSLLKQAPFLRSWNQFLDIYFQYEVEEVEGGIRSRVQPQHIQEELANLQRVDASEFYRKISCPVLILRATQGMVAEDDLLLPEDVAERMVREIPNAKRVDIEGTNHYTIVFHPNEKRDRAILEFLEA